MSAGFVTNNGLYDLIWGWVDPGVYYYDRFIQFGTGSGQGVTDSVLAAAAQVPVLATLSQETVNTTGDTARFTATITADTARSITEAGVLWDANGLEGMEVYGDFEHIDLALGDSIVFQVNVTITQGG